MSMVDKMLYDIFFSRMANKSSVARDEFNYNLTRCKKLYPDRKIDYTRLLMDFNKGRIGSDLKGIEKYFID